VTLIGYGKVVVERCEIVFSGIDWHQVLCTRWCLQAIHRYG